MPTNMIAVRRKIMVSKSLLLLLAMSGPSGAQSNKTPLKHGVKEVQVPFASLKPVATLKVGANADWVVVTEDAVWVAGTNPYSVWHRLDHRS